MRFALVRLKCERTTPLDSGSVEIKMKRTALAVAVTLTLMSGTLMSGATFAQSSYSGSKTELTTVAPAIHSDVTRTTHSATDQDGLLTEKHKTVSSGTTVSSSGETSSSKQKTETTTVR